MAYCTVHHWIESTGFCAMCARPFCEACLVPFMGHPHCGVCRDQRLSMMQGAVSPVMGNSGRLAGTGQVEIGRWISEGWNDLNGCRLNFALAYLVTGIISLVSVYICLAPLLCGLYLMGFRRIQVGHVSVDTLFDGFKRFGEAFLAIVLVAVLGAAVGFGLSLLMLVPFGLMFSIGSSAEQMSPWAVAVMAMFYLLMLVAMLLLSASTMFVLPHVAARHANPLEALLASWSVFRRNPVGFTLAHLAISIVAASGSLLCGIGAFLTVPLMFTAVARAYADHFGLDGVPAP